MTVTSSVQPKTVGTEGGSNGNNGNDNDDMNTFHSGNGTPWQTSQNEEKTKKHTHGWIVLTNKQILVRACDVTTNSNDDNDDNSSSGVNSRQNEGSTVNVSQERPPNETPRRTLLRLSWGAQSSAKREITTPCFVGRRGSQSGQEPNHTQIRTAGGRQGTNNITTMDSIESMNRVGNGGGGSYAWSEPKWKPENTRSHLSRS